MNTQSVAAVSAVSSPQGAAPVTAPKRSAPKDGTPATQPGSAPVKESTGEGRDPRSLQYQVDSSSRQIVATIVDSSNKTVIVQIPDAEALRIAKAIDRMQGFLVDHKA